MSPVSYDKLHFKNNHDNDMKQVNRTNWQSGPYWRSNNLTGALKQYSTCNFTRSSRHNAITPERQNARTPQLNVPNRVLILNHKPGFGTHMLLFGLPPSL